MSKASDWPSSSCSCSEIRLGDLASRLEIEHLARFFVLLFNGSCTEIGNRTLSQILRALGEGLDSEILDRDSKSGT